MWRVALTLLTGLLLFSMYMTFYTYTLDSNVSRLFIFFPKEGYSVEEVDRVLKILGDSLLLNAASLGSDSYCGWRFYETALGGVVRLFKCGTDNPNSFTYVNEKGLPFGKAGINGIDLAQEIILVLAYGKERAWTSFVIDTKREDGDSSLALITVRQSVAGFRVLGGGFDMLVDEEEGRLYKLVMHVIYGIDERKSPPKPDYETLLNVLRRLNIKGEPKPVGLLLCGGDTAYFTEVADIALALVSLDGRLLGLYVFDENAGTEVIKPNGCRIDWLSLPKNRYEPFPA